MRRHCCVAHFLQTELATAESSPLLSTWSNTEFFYSATSPISWRTRMDFHVMRFPKRIAEHKCIGAHNYCIILYEPEAGKIERARERKGIEATNYVDGIEVKLYGQPDK